MSSRFKKKTLMVDKQVGKTSTSLLELNSSYAKLGASGCYVTHIDVTSFVIV